MFVRLCCAIVLVCTLLRAASAQWDPDNGVWGKDDARDLRVMTWNVLDTITSGNATVLEDDNDWTAAARIIATLKPDLLIIQEGGVSNLAATIDKLFNGGPGVNAWVQKYAPGYTLPHIFASAIEDSFNRNAIVSLYPYADLNGDAKSQLSDIFFVGPDEYAPGGVGGIRGFMFAEIDLPDDVYMGDVVLGNAHLKAGGTSNDELQRRVAAQNVVYFIDYLLNGAGSGVPDPHSKISDSPPVQAILDDDTVVIYGGDWNEDEQTNGQKGPAEWLARAEFTGGTDGADRDRSDAVFDDARDIFTNSRETTASGKLDYICWQDSIASVRRHFIFDTARIIPGGAVMPPELIGPGGGSGASGLASNHLPIIADFILPLAPVVCDLPSDCDDGVACTDDDCVDNLCVNAPNAANCADGVDCTDDTCDPLEGCLSLANSANCDDGLACTLDICSPTNGCLAAPNNANCDDGIGCTDDVCDVAVGCLHDLNEQCQGITLEVSEKTAACSEPGLRICNLSVVFEDPSDRLISIGFTDIQTDAPDGFFQVSPEMGGANTAPLELLLGLFPILACDSFVTIGLKSVPVGQTDYTGVDPDFDAAAFNCVEPPDPCGQVSGGWYNSDPTSGQGTPDENGRVLVAQFTIADGSNVSGEVSIFFNDGVLELPVSFSCFVLCPADLNGDGVVNAADLALLLGAWGLNPGNPADLNDDGAVNAADLALLLGSWGPC